MFSSILLQNDHKSKALLKSEANPLMKILDQKQAISFPIIQQIGSTPLPYNKLLHFPSRVFLITVFSSSYSPFWGYFFSSYTSVEMP